MATNEGQVVLQVVQGIHVWRSDLLPHEREARAGQFWYYAGVLYRCVTDNDGTEPPSPTNDYYVSAAAAENILVDYGSDGQTWHETRRRHDTLIRLSLGAEGNIISQVVMPIGETLDTIPVRIWTEDPVSRANWRTLWLYNSRLFVTLHYDSGTNGAPPDNPNFQEIGAVEETTEQPVRIFTSEAIGTWLKHVSSDPPTSGDFSVAGVEDDLRINKTDADGNDQSAVLEAIEVGQALTFGADEFTFVIETQQLNEPTYIEWTGYWADARADDNIEDTRVAIGHIPHRVDMTGLLNERFSNLPRELEEETEARESADDRLEDLTVDIHLQDSPGVFADVTDSAVAGIGLIENTSANRSALDARTFNFGSVTWMNPSADIPDDGNDYWVVVRVALSLGHIETEFQLINDDPEEGTEHLRRSRQADADWYYYQVSADLESVWTLQRRTTSSHTRWDAPLGDIPLQQIQDLGFHGDGLTQDDIARALVPYGFSFIGVYPRYARLDQLGPENNWIIALGEVYPPFDTARYLQVNVNGVPVYRNTWSPTEKFILFSIEATADADNIESNTRTC